MDSALRLRTYALNGLRAALVSVLGLGVGLVLFGALEASADALFPVQFFQESLCCPTVEGWKIYTQYASGPAPELETTILRATTPPGPYGVYETLVPWNGLEALAVTVRSFGYSSSSESPAFLAETLYPGGNQGACLGDLNQDGLVGWEDWVVARTIYQNVVTTWGELCGPL
jgi:hypothetical protein